MRRLAAVAAGLMTISVAAGAAAEDPPGTEFLDSGFRADGFSFPSTSGWDIEGPARDRVVHVVRPPAPNAPSGLDRQGMAVLWAKRCKIGAQTVHFERDVYLAGPEDLLGAGISFFRGTNSAGFKGARLIVNGREVLDVGPAGGQFDRTDTRQKVFRFGNNHIEVIAEKRPNTRPRRCNNPLRKDDFTGVSFNTYGELAGDVALPPQQQEEYFRLPEGSLFAVNLPLDFSLKNNGPGGLARVPLHMSFDAPSTGEPHGTVVRVSSPQPPVHECEVFPPGNAQGYSSEQRRVVTCGVANLRAGASATQRVNFAFTPLPGDSKTPVYLRWSAFVDEPKGANGTDNERYKTIWICKSHDPDPKCPGEPTGGD